MLPHFLRLKCKLVRKTLLDNFSGLTFPHLVDFFCPLYRFVYYNWSVYEYFTLTSSIGGSPSLDSEVRTQIAYQYGDKNMKPDSNHYSLNFSVFEPVSLLL
jgi:hypothetical protein